MKQKPFTLIEHMKQKRLKLIENWTRAFHLLYEFRQNPPKVSAAYRKFLLSEAQINEAVALDRMIEELRLRA